MIPIARLLSLIAAAALFVASPALSRAQTRFDGSPALTLLWEQAAAQPDDYAVACLPLANPSRTITRNGQERFPLASVSKLLIFIAYAERLAAGAIRLEERVDVGRLDRYNLPRTDRGAHDRFMRIYPEGTTSISLWDVAATGMMQYSSNAASDYLLERLQPVDWQSLYVRLSLTNTGYPHSLTMIPLLMNNHELGRVGLDDIEGLSIEAGEAFLDRYIHDEPWRQAEIAYRSRPFSQFPAWNVQAAILQQHTATGTAVDALKIMRAIYDRGGPLSDAVKTMTRTALRWTESDFISNNYVEYGSKLGFYSGGLLALVAYGQPYGGEPVISVAFFRNIPRSTYNRMLREDSIGDLAHWLNFNQCAGLTDVILTAQTGQG